jgi:voltage-gated potassium channel
MLPSHRYTPIEAVLRRLLLALGLLVLTTVIVYSERRGYTDIAMHGRPVGLLGACYYSAVTLSTTGYGDIVPVSATARLVNIIVITPIRVIFLIVLIGTTLEVLAERTRTSWRISRWRSKVAGHTVIVGYGTKGRSAMASLRTAGVPRQSVVVVDIAPLVIDEVNRSGVVAVAGDGTKRSVLSSAQVGQAARVIVAVARDDTAVLIALTARQLNAAAVIVAAVREAENEPLLRQSGADQVVVSSETAGRLLGLSTLEPGAGLVMAKLVGRQLDLIERPAVAAEIGQPALAAGARAIAVLRDGAVLALDDPRAGQIEDGDRLVLVSAAAPGG